MINKNLNKNLHNFNKERNDFYNKYPDFYANDGSFQYALYQTFMIDKKLEDEIKFATNELWEVFLKVKNYLLTLNEKELKALNFSPKLIKYINSDYLTYHSFLSRMDWVVDLNTREIKCIELNNETPFYILETFKMNDLYLNHKENIKTKNNYINNIKDSFEQVIIDSSHFLKKETKDLRIAILGSDKYENKEEYSLISYYKELFSPFYNVELIHYEDLAIIQDDGLYNKNNEKIDVLFHPSYPIDYLQYDMSDKKEPIGIWLLDLVQNRRLSLINPPINHFLQDKTILSLVYALAELQAPFLTNEDCYIVDKYLAKTYTSSFYFEEEDIKYVQKPINGRRGISVTIKDSKNILYKPMNDDLKDEVMIYQEFHELPTIEVIVNEEIVYKKLLISSYITKGEYNGLVTIVGDEIIDDKCQWLPHLIKEY